MKFSEKQLEKVVAFTKKATKNLIIREKLVELLSGRIGKAMELYGYSAALILVNALFSKKELSEEENKSLEEVISHLKENLGDRNFLISSAIIRAIPGLNL